MSMACPPSQFSLIRMRRLRGIGAIVIGVGAGGLISGCASPQGPDYLTIPASDYTAAFDAAMDAARIHGLPAVLRDRRAGVIETDPRIAGSVLEPWRTDNANFKQALEN